jgi:hypothetical protein
MRKTAWLLTALAAALPTPAWATAGFCEDLRLMIRSVRDSPTFSSVTRNRPPPDLALFHHCDANQHDFTSEVICAWQLPSAAPAVEDLTAEALRCLPGARRRNDPNAALRGEALLDFEFLAITIAQSRIASGATGDGARVTIAILEG